MERGARSKNGKSEVRRFMSGLTSYQKQRLARLCERAFNRQAALARGRGEAVATDWRSRAAWRHQEVAAACGKEGLRCCDQGDYKVVEARFLELLGESGQAMEAEYRGASEAQRQVEWVICRACEKWGLPLNYVNAICRTQFGCDLTEATLHQLKALLATVNNRGRAKARKGAEASDAKP